MNDDEVLSTMIVLVVLLPYVLVLAMSNSNLLTIRIVVVNFEIEN